MNTRAERYATNILKYPTKKEARLASGYSPSYATSGHIEKTEAVKKAMSTILEQLEEERQRILDEMKVKDLSAEKYKDLVDAMDKITKNTQLLGGKPTERIDVSDLSNLSDEELDEIIAERPEGESTQGES